MEILSIILHLLVALPGQNQQLYRLQEGIATFRSEAPLELIEASTSTIVGLIDREKKTFAIRIPVASFEGFNSPLQREHFNENYLETDRYPNAQFSGEIDGDVNFDKPGVYEVFAKGTFDLHGEKQNRAIQATITIDANGDISVSSSFIVQLKDHSIKIPTIVRYKIAETINVSFSATMTKK